ncbi:MAG: hypothetical protein IIC86_04415 [Chloroflexi bacterium]|nr:hypothetical protein [Chloroflexota bacterium]
MSVNIQEQFQKLGLGEKIILIAGPLLFIVSFLPWYSISFEAFGFSESITRSAWQSPGAIWSMLAVFIGLVMTGLIAAVRFGNVKLPEMPQGVTWGRIMLGLGSASALLVVIKLISESSFLGFGFYIGIILVIALAAGGFLTFQEEKRGGRADAGPAGGGTEPPGGGGADAGPSI